MFSQEERCIHYDADLQIEAYHLYGIVRKFPNHFHDYYVIGFIERGKRHLECKDREYSLSAGDLILFNPRDNHFCSPINQESFDYRAINIPIKTMLLSAKEITGKDYTPHFTHNVIYQSDITKTLSDLYHSILYKAPKLEKEETFILLLVQILQEYSLPFEEAKITEPSDQIQNLCTYMENHYNDNITLNELISMTDFSKSYFLRLFTKQIGVSPYRYLQTIRIGKAKELLEQGISPIEVSYLTGFSDQSHFTNFFKEFIGLTPKQYQKIFIDSTQTTNTTKGASK